MSVQIDSEATLDEGQINEVIARIHQASTREGEGEGLPVASLIALVSIVDELGSNASQVDLGVIIDLMEHLFYQTPDLHKTSNGLLALKYTLQTLHKLVRAQHLKSADYLTSSHSMR